MDSRLRGSDKLIVNRDSLKSINAELSEKQRNIKHFSSPGDLFLMTGSSSGRSPHKQGMPWHKASKAAKKIEGRLTVGFDSL